VTSAGATLTVNSVTVAPTITTQPASQTVNAGANVSFTVVASGTAPLSYQWQKNGTSISDATSATLTLSSVTTDSAGSYTVRVSNTAGSVTSAAATLTVQSSTVNTPPSVQMVQPTSASTFRPRSDIRLVAQASDANGRISSVRFYNGSQLLGTGSLVSGTTNRYSMVWNNVPSGQYYLKATATDNQGTTSTSTSVRITVGSSGRSND
jgi:hypothetical protein